MSPRWLRRGASRDVDSRSGGECTHGDGCPVLLRQLDTAEGEDRVIEALAERYEVKTLEGEKLSFRVRVDDARFPDEAVVRLASSLDEIDRDWQERFAWPKADRSVA